jgi:hypothetical protein
MLTSTAGALPAGSKINRWRFTFAEVEAQWVVMARRIQIDYAGAVLRKNDFEMRRPH